MYWWDRAAELLTRQDTRLRRFGLVTTNSITQVFQNRVVERRLKSPSEISIVLAIPDHPWTKASKDAAAVRIAITVVEGSKRDGVLRSVVREAQLDTDEPAIGFSERVGTINADLSIGADLTSAKPLLSNSMLCSPGVKLHGDGFLVTKELATKLGLGRRAGLDKHIREYRNGRDLTGQSRNLMVIDLLGLSDREVRSQFPEVYQHLLENVKPEREKNNRATYRENWWLFGEPRRDLRPALKGLRRFIATVETAKHRAFQFLDASILPDNMLVVMATDDPFHLGVLSSRTHVTWALRAGGWLGIGNDPRYSKSRCFDPFPFPHASAAKKNEIGALAEELDARRKAVFAEHPDLTLTALYNTMDEIRGGLSLNAKSLSIRDRGQVLILKELHEKIDAKVVEAYGWISEPSEDQILDSLVALNAERASGERVGVTVSGCGRNIRSMQLAR